MSEWLPKDHLAWFVLDAVAELDLAAFYASYRNAGWGGAAHDPAMMVALLVYAYDGCAPAIRIAAGLTFAGAVAAWLLPRATRAHAAAPAAAASAT